MQKNYIIDYLLGKISFEECVEYCCKEIEEEIRTELDEKNMSSYYQKSIDNNKKV